MMKTERRFFIMWHMRTVSAGIDFDKLKVKVNPDKKEIRITVPEAKILDCSVNEGSLKYIFEKMNIMLTISADAYKVSKRSTEKKANEETRITGLQKKMRFLQFPVLIEDHKVDQVDDEYTVIIK